MKNIILLLCLLCLGCAEGITSQKSTPKPSPQESLNEVVPGIDSEEYIDDAEEEDTDADYDYYDEEDEQEVENSVDLELEEPNMSSNDTSRFFRLRQKRRRRRKPRRGRRPRRGRGRRQRRPPPPVRPFGFGGRLKSPKPTEESEEQPVKHGNLINYAEPIGPFYSETSHIPLPDTPVLLAIYPKKRKSRVGSPERKLEFKREPPPTVSTTTTTTTWKPEVIHHYHYTSTKAPQPLQQTFNIALPQMHVQPQPIVIQQQAPPTKAPTQTKISVSAFVKEIQPRPQLQPASWTTPRPVYGVPVAPPNYQYGVPNSVANRRCATWTPFFYKNLQQNRGSGSHYFGRRIDSVDDQKSCQYQNSVSNSVNTNSWQNSWSSSSNNYRAPAPSTHYELPYANNFNQGSTGNNPNIVTTITRYQSQPVTTNTATSTFQITPSQAYEISQNLYESFKQKLLHEQQQQQFSTNAAQPLPFADTTQNAINGNTNTFSNDLSNSVNTDTDFQSQGQNQNQGSSNFEQVPDVAVPVYQNLKPPKESHNYLTFQNNQLSSEDYEFPVSDEQVEEFNLPPKKQKKKKKRVPTKSKTKVKQKKKEKFKVEKDKFIPDILEAVKSDLEVVPIRIFNNLFPKIFMSETKNGGKDIEFTIGK